VGGTDYAATANSDVVIITAGFARRPGMSRNDFLWTNYEVVKRTVGQSVAWSPGCILVMVTSPLDAMCHVALKVSGFPRTRVFGMAGVLDSARFRTFVSEELNVSVEDIVAFVMGGHGDLMVPLMRYTNVAGIPITDLLDEAAIERIVRRTREGGAEILRYLKTESAYYAPGAAVAEMVASILKDKRRVLPCSAYLEGEYGIHGLFVGVPVILGEHGIERIFEVKLTNSESAALEKSAAAVRELVDVMAPHLAELGPAGAANDEGAYI
jgi:malate dehydrogenase